MSNNGTNTKNKKVLMFCPTFFGYENRVADAMRDEGYEVDLYDERPNSGFICKTSLRLNLKLYKPIVRKYIQKVIDENRGKKYDYVFVVKSEATGKNEIEMLRKAYPEAEFILYFWDSVANVPDGEKKIGLYDRVLTFDPVDAKKYNLPFLPIPYGKEHEQTEDVSEHIYDAAFIGTAHSVRPRVVKQIKEQCGQYGRKCFTYFYSPHVLVYLLNKLTNPNYKHISLKEIHFKPLPSAEVCKIYKLSKAVIDIEHPKQQGTTTRPVEMLPMKKKIITTNSFVKEFAFYNTNNFCIIDRNDPKIDEDFFDTEYLPVKQEVLDKYSPKAFVRTLFENERSGE